MLLLIHLILSHHLENLSFLSNYFCQNWGRRRWSVSRVGWRTIASPSRVVYSEMAITLIAGLGVFQTCPTNEAAIPILNMVAAMRFLDCISTGRAVLHVPIPFCTIQA